MRRRGAALARAHPALAPAFSSAFLNVLRALAPVRGAEFSRITTHYDRVYALADFAQEQAAQRSGTVAVRALACKRLVCVGVAALACPRHCVLRAVVG